MAWHGVAGHDPIVERFRRAVSRNRLASTFLFVGPAGIGKRTFAVKLAQALLCQTNPEAALEPCGLCDSCQQVAAGTHPDLLRVAKPKDKSEIPIKLLIGDGERRMREGMCYDISLKPFMGGRRIAIIDDADLLNEEGANCLLKTLEEPPPRSVLILIGTSANKQYSTIRSRSQIVRFRPLPQDTVAQLLIEHQLIDDPATAARLAGYSDGSVQQALELADPALWTFRNDLLTRLTRPIFSGVRVAESTVAFVKEAGTDAPPRRARCRQLIGFAVEFYRQLLRTLAGSEPATDAELQTLIDRAVSNWPADEDRIAACLNRCLEALGHIDRNANQNTMLECWLDDLAAISAGHTPVSAGNGR